MKPSIQIYPADEKQFVSSTVFDVLDRVFCDCFSMTSTEAKATLIGVYQRRINSVSVFAFSLWKIQFARNRTLIRRQFRHSL